AVLGRPKSSRLRLAGAWGVRRWSSTSMGRRGSGGGGFGRGLSGGFGAVVTGGPSAHGPLRAGGEEEGEQGGQVVVPRIVERPERAAPIRLPVPGLAGREAEEDAPLPEAAEEPPEGSEPRGRGGVDEPDEAALGHPRRLRRRAEVVRRRTRLVGVEAEGEEVEHEGGGVDGAAHPGLVEAAPAVGGHARRERGERARRGVPVGGGPVAERGAEGGVVLHVGAHPGAVEAEAADERGLGVELRAGDGAVHAVAGWGAVSGAVDRIFWRV